MTLEFEEQKKLKEFEHSLELKRIWRKGLWTLAALLVTAALANWLGVKYSSDLRRQEVEQQHLLDLANQRQSLYYAKRFESFRQLDSMYIGVVNAYLEAVNLIKLSKDTNAIVTGMLKVYTLSNETSNRNQECRFYLDQTYFKQFNRRLRLYSLLPTNPYQWPIYQDFLASMRDDIVVLMNREISFVVHPQEPLDTGSIFLLPAYVGDLAADSASAAKARDYINNSYKMWISRQDSLARPPITGSVGRK
jgi:hypothetical protein